MRQYLLGIDIGTQSVRTALFDTQGNMLESFSIPQYMQNPRPGWATEKPEEWWYNVKICIAGLFKRTAVSPKML